MALFITKINTTETNFSYRYLRLLQLCQNADHGDQLFSAVSCSNVKLQFVFVHRALTIFITPAGHYGEISPRQQPTTARDFTGSNLCHIIKYFITDRSNFSLHFRIINPLLLQFLDVFHPIIISAISLYVLSMKISMATIPYQTF